MQHTVGQGSRVAHGSKSREGKLTRPERRHTNRACLVQPPQASTTALVLRTAVRLFTQSVPSVYAVSKPPVRGSGPAENLPSTIPQPDEPGSGHTRERSSPQCRSGTLGRCRNEAVRVSNRGIVMPPGAPELLHINRDCINAHCAMDSRCLLQPEPGCFHNSVPRAFSEKEVGSRATGHESYLACLNHSLPTRCITQARGWQLKSRLRCATIVGTRR